MSNVASGKEVAGLADDSEHGKLSHGIKKTVDGTKAWVRNLAENAEWIFGRRAARVLGVVVLFAVVVTLLFLLLNLYVRPTEPSEKKDLVLTLAQILGGTALLLGLYVTWRTLQVNREGQITDRFTRVIDQLGATDAERNKLFEIRLGGIYALERIARESAEDHWPVMEVLTAYVRQHAPRSQEEAVEDAEGSTAASEPTQIPSRDPDIQAIMTVLRRRTHYFGHGEPEALSLGETNLRRANLSEANLSGASFYRTNLWKASLQKANLSEAILWNANLQEANLPGADLSGAILTRTYLPGANLSGVNLSGATLTGANLERADFSGANLTGADLSRARHLTQEQLEETTGDENTLLDSNFKPPAHWGREY